MSYEERSFTHDAVAIEGIGNKPKIVGYAAVFNSPSEEMPVRGDDPNGRKFREIVRPGAFTQSLVERREVVALFQHDKNALLGITSNGTLRITEDNRGLRYEIDPPNTQAGRDTVELIRRGDVRMSSFGFRVRGSGGQSLKRDGGEIVRELRSVELLDVSPVAIGAYRATHVSLRSLDKALLELLDERRRLSRMAMRLELAERV